MKTSSSSSKKSAKSGKPRSGPSSRSPTSENKPDPRHSFKSSTEDANDDGWSEWEWDQQWQREWRSREKPDGEWEYDLRYPNDEATPRNPPSFGGTQDVGSIDGVLQRGDGFTTSSQLTDSSQILTSNYGNSLTAGSNPAYSHNPAIAPILSLTHNLNSNQASSGFQRALRSNDGESRQVTGDKASPYATANTLQGDECEEEDYDEDSDDEGTTRSATQRRDRLRGSEGNEIPLMTNDSGVPIKGGSWQGDPQEGRLYDAEETDILYTMPSRAPKSSYSVNYADPVASLSNAYQNMSLTQGELPTANSPVTEQAPSVNTRYIDGEATVDESAVTSSSQRPLHGSFKVHHAKDFEFGKIFKILWTEPRGQGQATARTESFPTKHGEESYTSIRRFVIVKKMNGHCLCIPILTYHRQGAAKSGAKPEDHAIIYTKKDEKTQKPKETSDESKLPKQLRPAIRMDPKTGRDQLDPTSRLNYAKIYTVEYNVKVCFIGKIHKESTKQFIKDFNLTHTPLLEDEYTDFSNEAQDLHQAGERESEPHNESESRDTEPSKVQERSQGENEQHSSRQRGRGGKKKK